MTAVTGDPPAKRPTGGKAPVKGGAAAALVATGILTSRVFGLVRQILQSHFLGTTGAADAFMAAFKAPNFLQTMFGEGALSASFIPVYSRLLAEGREEEAGRLAGAIVALLALVVAVVVATGVLIAPILIPLIAPGFDPARRALTIDLTRIFFPGAGIFVLSAWCLGVLNSHRRYLISYSAPVFWNLAMIAALIWGGRAGQAPTRLVVTLAWASVVGAALQFLVQVPTALAVTRPLRVSLDTKSEHVRKVSRNFGPVFVSRGVVQISGYIDGWLASFLPKGIVATLGYAQTVYVLPVSLFGMAISAAELPEMSRAIGDHDTVSTYLRGRLSVGLRNIAYFVVPSAAAFLTIGDKIAGLLFGHGRFSPADTRYAWGILAGAAVGLLATTMGRLYSSTYYALHDTKTPLRYAIVRIVLTSVLGALFALWLPKLLHIDQHWGSAGLTISAGMAGWVEFVLLRRTLNSRIGHTGVPGRYVASLWGASAVAALAAWGVRGIMAGHSRHLGEALIIATFGLAYLGTTIVLGVPEARGALKRLRRR